MWKPGQIVTIEHKKYRVKHGRVRWCRFCPNNKPGNFLTAVCVACYTNCGYYDYLEEIKPKRKKSNPRV